MSDRLTDRLISPPTRASARNSADTEVETSTETSTKSSEREGLTYAEVLALPVTVDVTTAARALGLGRSTAYELARRNALPCRVLHIGGSYRIPTADLLRTLGIGVPAQSSPPKENPARSAHSRNPET